MKPNEYNMKYGIFIEEANGRVAPSYELNSGFDANDPGWLYPFPSLDHVTASFNKNLDILRSRGNPDGFVTLLIKTSNGQIIHQSLI
jgi:hypothetical protein